jgi:hypothetical protein
LRGLQFTGEEDVEMTWSVVLKIDGEKRNEINQKQIDDAASNDEKLKSESLIKFR